MRVRLLGGLTVDGVDRRALGSRKARLLLARLAVSPGRVVTSDRLVDCVWGDDPPSRPRADLSVLASRLRTVLGRDRIEHDGVGYRLVVDWVDVEGPSRVPPAGAPSGALVGRELQLRALDAALVASRSGPQVVVVAGPAGIGKSALLRAWAERARAAGATVLDGAFDPLGRDLPLQAELDAMATHLHAHPADAALVAGSLVVLGPLLEVAGRAPPTETATTPGTLRVEPAASAGAGAGAGVSLVHHALADVLGRLAAGRPVALLLDDAHLAGPSTAGLLGHLRRRAVPVAVVAAVRGRDPGELPATRVIEVGPLDEADAAALVGAAEAARLHARSGGNPLFLLELAQAPDGDLPATLAAAVTARLPSDPVARSVFETAAVLGEPDVATIARVAPRAPAAARWWPTTSPGLPPPGWLHEAARAAADRAVAVAEHARLGGDVTLAAEAYDRAAELATARHDHGAALDYLDRARALAPTPARLVGRARAATLAGRFAEARGDAAAAVGDDPSGEAYEIGAWAAYFARDFADATSWADDGVALATTPAVATRCLMIAGRIRHATGDLAPAEQMLESALARTRGTTTIAAAWLGCLRSHQSRPADALALLRAAARAAGPADSAAHLHALLFTGHAALAVARPRRCSCSSATSRRPSAARRCATWAAAAMRRGCCATSATRRPPATRSPRPGTPPRWRTPGRRRWPPSSTEPRAPS